MAAPVRDGINARPIRIRSAGTALARVSEVLPQIASELPQAFDRGDIVDDDGESPLTPDSPVRVGQVVWAFGGVTDEPDEPITVPILAENERWLAVDKPHDLATMPRGRHVAHTLTVALRRQLTNDQLVAAHRLDAATAGVVLVTKEPQWRGPYQLLFEHRRVTKEYLAVADVSSMDRVPVIGERQRIELRLEKPRTSTRTLVEAGQPNSLTDIKCVWHSGEIAGFRVRPLTGRTHQIRAVFAHLGMPIVGDLFYGHVGVGGEG
ncbi:MAG: pseudouridine synthase, partial [Ancrocorticia sp.]